MMYSGGPIIADTLSLCTTIPMFIVKQWELKSGDKLDWSLEARGKNEIVFLYTYVSRVCKIYALI